MSWRTILRLACLPGLLVLAVCGPGGPGGPPSPSPPPPPPPPSPPPPGSPVVTAGANSSLPAGTPYALSATFVDSTSHGPWSYEIDWGDGSRANGSKSSISPITDSHEFATQGNYGVSVKVTNKSGKTGSGSLTVTATAPVLIAAGDIGDCARTSDNETGVAIDTIPGIVVPLGDNAYLDGTLGEYNQCYDPVWGRFKPRTRPVPGNHDYNTPGASGYFSYFGAAAGDPAKGYYSYTLGSWFVIVLNTGTERPVDFAAGSTQEQWLRNELATHSQQCVLALMHHPRFSTTSGRDPIRPELEAFWNALYQHGADLVVNGHDHNYQRFAPQRPDGTPDATYGIRQITVGTGGGETLYSFDRVPARSNLQVRNNDTFGVLKVTLKSGGYEWRFVRAAGGTFTDSGSGTCHGRPL